MTYVRRYWRVLAVVVEMWRVWWAVHDRYPVELLVTGSMDRADRERQRSPGR